MERQRLLTPPATYPGNPQEKNALVVMAELQAAHAQFTVEAFAVPTTWPLIAACTVVAAQAK